MKENIFKYWNIILIVLSFAMLFTTYNKLGGTLSMLITSFYVLLVGLFYKKC